MDQHEQLRQLAFEYQRWMQERKYKTAPVPKHFKQSILDLVSHFSKKHIAEILGLSPASIYQWVRAVKPKENSTESAFIALPQVIEQDNMPSRIWLKLTNKQGLKLELSGDICAMQLRVLAEIMAQ